MIEQVFRAPKERKSRRGRLQRKSLPHCSRRASSLFFETMNPPYRADHVGSFLRASELLEARKNASREELEDLEDQQIRRILTVQKELGFEIATDGEFRRRNFMSDFTDAVEGFDLGDAVGRTWNGGRI